MFIASERPANYGLLIKIISKNAVAAIACAIALSGFVSACYSSSDSATSAIETVESDVAVSGTVPEEISSAFYVAYCDKAGGTLNEATGECATPDGATTKIDVAYVDNTSSAMLISMAYEDPGVADIAGCPTRAEMNAAASASDEAQIPTITFDCHVAVVEAMTAALVK